MGGSSSYLTQHANHDTVTIACQVTKYRLRFDTSIPPEFEHRIDSNTWTECMTQIRDGAACADSFDLRKNSKICKRCCIILILVFCSCFPSSCISFLSALTSQYRPYYVAALVFLILSIIAMVLFVRYAYKKVNYDNLWTLKVYNGVDARLNHLNNHKALKNYLSFHLTNTVSSSPYTISCSCYDFGALIAVLCCCCCYQQNKARYINKRPMIQVVCKKAQISVPPATVYQPRMVPYSNFAQSQSTQIQVHQHNMVNLQHCKENANNSKEPLLRDWSVSHPHAVTNGVKDIYHVPQPSAPMLDVDGE